MENIISAKNDIVFKAVFVRDKELLRGFLNDVVGLTIASVDDITILNPEITPDLVGQKFARLDINARAGNDNINIEMQTYRDRSFVERDLFYWAKMYSDSLKGGDDYSDLRRTISVSVLDFNLFDCPGYHSEFCIMEKNRLEVLTDMLSMHFYELKKIKGIEENLNISDKKLLWLQLIKANREEEFKMLEESGNALIRRGVKTIYDVNADDNVREMIRMEEKRLLDQTYALNQAKREGREEGIGIGREEGIGIGKESERVRLMSLWRDKGFSEEQIKELLGE